MGGRVIVGLGVGGCVTVEWYVCVCTCVPLCSANGPCLNASHCCLFSVCHAHVPPPSSVAHTETPSQRLPGVGQQCQLAEGPQCSG